MNEVYTLVIPSAIGAIRIVGSSRAITGLYFDDTLPSDKSVPDILEQCALQVDEYFCGKRQAFTVPLLLEGTAFQQKVWVYLQTIPFGTTITYREMAIALGDVKAIRAVAKANGSNPVSLIVPCHRVIGSDGRLVGYAGGLWRKQFLLELENPLWKANRLF